jgi:hypothetical protein
MQGQNLLVQVDLMGRQINSMRQEAADATDPAVAAAFLVIANEYNRRLNILKAEALTAITSHLTPQVVFIPDLVSEPVFMADPTPNINSNTNSSNA